MAEDTDLPYIIRAGSGLGYNTPWHVFWGSLLGGPFAGFWLMAKNYKLAKIAGAHRLARFSAVASVLLWAFFLVTVNSVIPSVLVHILCAAALAVYAGFSQSKLLAKLVASDYFKNVSLNVIWVVLFSWGVSILSVLACLPLAAAGLFFLKP